MIQTTQLTIGGLGLPEHRHISLGPRHPTAAGLIRIDITSAHSTIRSAHVSTGYAHRAAEKLFEVRDYRSAIMLADRHDWWSAFSGELLVTLTIEEAMRLTPAIRSIPLRILLAELFRLHSHMGFLSHLADDRLGDKLWDWVDHLRQALLAWTGNRVHPMLVRIGGLSADAPEGWLDALNPLLDDASRLAEALRARLAATQRFSGLATIDRDTCLAYGLSGPVSRACGLDLDRRRSGYLAYDSLYRATPPREAGDAEARFGVLLDELDASIEMIREARRIADETPGDVAVRLSRRIKVPEGDHAAEVEAPWGIASCFLVSRGGQTPWRVGLRTPSLSNLSALEQALVGVPLDSLADAIASVGFTASDADK